VTDIVEAARFTNRVEGDLARLYLGSEGIEAMLFDTETNYLYGGLFMPVRLMVLDEDLEEARRLLAQNSES
jgi:putative signal transducing protein